MNAVVPIVMPRDPIHLSLDSPFVQLIIISIFLACAIYCLESFIKFIIFIIRRLRK